MREETNCNGGLIRHYRRQLALTQLQLATRAGLSERVVRKAESDGVLRADSLELLAAALGSAVMPLHANDLRSDPLAIAQAYMRSYLQHGTESAARARELFAPNVVMSIHTDDPNLQFAGDFHGVEGIDRMIRYAYAQFVHVKKDFGRWSVNGQRAVAMCEEVLQAAADPASPLLRTWILHEYTVANGLIRRIDNYIDSAAWSRYLVEVNGVHGVFDSVESLRLHVEGKANALS